MLFEQKVILKGTDPLDEVRSFHDRRFVEFLTAMQPVKIQNWIGINNNMKASFSFWFFGWRQIEVELKNYKASKNHLHFEDRGLVLPFGLSSWRHYHIVEPHKNGTIIIDKVEMGSQRSWLRYFIFPIMLFPIFIRRLTYRFWFYLMEGKTWISFKRFVTNEKI